VEGSHTDAGGPGWPVACPPDSVETRSVVAWALRSGCSAEIEIEITRKKIPAAVLMEEKTIPEL
jgi:hypothetical protein